MPEGPIYSLLLDCYLTSLLTTTMLKCILRMVAWDWTDDSFTIVTWREQRETWVKEVLKWRTHFLNQNEGVQASKPALQLMWEMSDLPLLDRLLFLCLHFGVSSIFFCPRVGTCKSPGFLWMQNKSTSSGMTMEHFFQGKLNEAPNLAY